MDLNFKLYGENNTKTIVILHGLFGLLDNWASVAKYLSEEKDFKVYLVDLRNHGRSPFSDKMDYNSISEDLLVFMLNNKIYYYTLLGHSMGGKAAMFFACTYPQEIKKLIVVDIAPKYYLPHHNHIFEALNALNLNNLENRKQAYEHLFAYLKDEAVVNFLLKNLYLDENKKYKWRFNLPVLSSKINFLGQKLPENFMFDKPTLFLKGELSNYITKEDFVQIKIHFPNSEIIEVPNAGHWVQVDNFSFFVSKI